MEAARTYHDEQRWKRSNDCHSEDDCDDLRGALGVRLEDVVDLW